MSDVVDGRAVLWISGGNLEDTRQPAHVRGRPGPPRPRASCCCGPRTGSRTTSPTRRPTGELTRGERVAWDIVRDRPGRAARACRSGASAQLYDFRLQHGFTDVADAAFERLWDAPTMTCAGIREICKETGAADRGRLEGPGRPPPPEVARSRLRSASGDSTSRQIVGARWCRRGRSSGFVGEQRDGRGGHVDHERGVEVGPGRVGRVPLLDHEESATLRGRRDAGRRCGSRPRRGSARRSGPARAASSSSAPGRASNVAVSTAISTSSAMPGSSRRVALATAVQ